MTFRFDSLHEAGGRSENQDAVGHAGRPSDGVCWVVADGLGGHAGGAVAAQVAVRGVLDGFEQAPAATPEAVQHLIERAQDEVLRRQHEEPSLAEMRTTLLVLAVDAESAIWGHLGDTRLYMLRGGAIRHQTKDHSVPQAMAAAGDLEVEDVRFHEDRNRVLRSIGQPDEIRPAIPAQPERVEAGDAFLLCTDGFWEHVYETEMEADFAKSESPGRWLNFMRERLIRRAGPGGDNYSAMAVFVDE